eukprot:CAMPEP_0177595022 /NCGR_PEP_ID=MMETSP0419_2-20121207/10115_1 /TAXON_ID=582737 /ORGANISM="Tetraselmis sp., Strain GSL018" /LENGTH=167 /DNA_ID=CAMNT_0019086415 /DNA_START=123 /DNA_END=627 /DNA_ORIENTATION=-
MEHCRAVTPPPPPALGLRVAADGVEVGGDLPPDAALDEPHRHPRARLHQHGVGEAAARRAVGAGLDAPYPVERLEVALDKLEADVAVVELVHRRPRLRHREAEVPEPAGREPTGVLLNVEDDAGGELHSKREVLLPDLQEQHAVLSLLHHSVLLQTWYELVKMRIVC